MSAEPDFLSVEDVIQIHDEQIAVFLDLNGVTVLDPQEKL